MQRQSPVCNVHIDGSFSYIYKQVLFGSVSSLTHCIRRQFFPRYLVKLVRTIVTPSLEFSMIHCNSGHLCYANTLFYQQPTDTYYCVKHDEFVPDSAAMLCLLQFFYFTVMRISWPYMARGIAPSLASTRGCVQLYSGLSLAIHEVRPLILSLSFAKLCAGSCGRLETYHRRKNGILVTAHI